MKLIIEPNDGVSPLLTAIRSAKKSVEIAIFRLDRKDIIDQVAATLLLESFLSVSNPTLLPDPEAS